MESNSPIVDDHKQYIMRNLMQKVDFLLSLSLSNVYLNALVKSLLNFVYEGKSIEEHNSTVLWEPESIG